MKGTLGEVRDTCGKRVMIDCIRRTPLKPTESCCISRVATTMFCCKSDPKVAELTKVWL